MTSFLESATPIQETNSSSLWVVYGKSASGKTTLASTFPKPLLLLTVGDDGQESIRDVEGIYTIPIASLKDLNDIIDELRHDKTYATVVVDTFSLIVNEWIEAEVLSKGKKMTMNNWGELKSETEALIRKFKMLANNRHVVLTCHEVTDSIEGMEEELLPDVRPSVSKGSRTYLESMANFGIHTTVLHKEVVDSTGRTRNVSKFAAHLGAHPYYWVKTQKPQSVEVPAMLLDPTYTKITTIIGGKDNG